MKQLLRHMGTPKIRLFVLCVVAVATSFPLFGAFAAAQVAPFAFPGAKPADIPQTWRPLIGEYGPENDPFVVLERTGHLVLRADGGTEFRLLPAGGGNFAFTKPLGPTVQVSFARGANGLGYDLLLDCLSFPRRRLGPEEGQVFRIQPSRSIQELRREALAASPPQEAGKFRQPDLVELARVDSDVHLDIRYATENDFLGTPVYTQARAFLQRPAAEALVRALRRLQPYGYGLLIHDAYRPWYVTKIFWDATPPEGKSSSPTPHKAPATIAAALSISPSTI